MSDPAAPPSSAGRSAASPAATPGTTGEAILVVDNITRRFGGITAVDVDHLEIERGKITALIGPNGAGKTTFFNLITGFDRPEPIASNGAKPSWTFDGTRLNRTSATGIARAGMVRTFQLTKALSRLTVMDNMLLGAKDHPGERLLNVFAVPWWRAVEAAARTKARELLQRFRLWDKRDDYAGSLSGGQRKLLEMARALMSDPEMIMLDEPMAGVNPALTQSLLGHVQQLCADGTTVLFVEHDMHVVRYISDRVVVMAEGKVVAQGDADTVMADPAVVDAYLGAHHDTDLGSLSLDEVTSEAQAEEGIR